MSDDTLRPGYVGNSYDHLFNCSWVNKYLTHLDGATNTPL